MPRKTADDFRKISEAINLKRIEERANKQRRDQLWKEIIKATLAGNVIYSTPDLIDEDVDYLGRIGFVVQYIDSTVDKIAAIEQKKEKLEVELEELNAEIERLEENLWVWNRRHDTSDVLNDWLRLNRKMAEQSDLEKWFGKGLVGARNLTDEQLSDLYSHLSHQKSWTQIQGKRDSLAALLEVVRECQKPAENRSGAVERRKLIDKIIREARNREAAIQNLEDRILVLEQSGAGCRYSISWKNVIFDGVEDLDHQHSISLMNWISSSNGDKTLSLFEKLVEQLTMNEESEVHLTVALGKSFATITEVQNRFSRRVPSVDVFIDCLRVLKFKVRGAAKNAGAITVHW